MSTHPNTRPRVLICANAATRQEIVAGEGVARLERIADWEWLPSEGVCTQPGIWGGPSDDPADAERLRARIGNADILLVCHGSPLIDATMLDAAPILAPRDAPAQPHRLGGGAFRAGVQVTERVGDQMYRRIVVALDGSELAARVLPHAEALAERFGAQLILVRATPVKGVTDEALDADRRETDRYLTELLQQLSARGLQVHYQRLEGQPSTMIAEFARSQDADLIALTSHGQSGPQGTLFGRVAESVMLTASCSLLLIRADRAA